MEAPEFDVISNHSKEELSFSLCPWNEATFLWDGLIERFSLCDGSDLLSSLFHLQEITMYKIDKGDEFSSSLMPLRA